ncbi:hypothetical protein [Streptosporangium sp. NPDC002721]
MTRDPVREPAEIAGAERGDRAETGPVEDTRMAKNVLDEGHGGGR